MSTTTQADVLNQSMDVHCTHCNQPHRIDMEYTDCCLCGADDAEPLHRRSDLALGLPGEFTIVRCRNCQLIYQNPRPTVSSIGYYYPPNYQVYSLPEVDEMPNAWSRWLHSMHLNKRCKAVVRYQSGGRLLDVGCSTGRFLHHMRHFGNWERLGVELIDEAAEAGRSRYGLQITTGALEDAELPNGSLDVITLWDVLEHVYNPVETLKDVSRLLTPEGYLIFSIPILDSLGGKIFGKYWVGYEIPRHLHIFSRDTLGQMLALADLTQVDEMVLYGSNYAFADNMYFTLRGNGFPKFICDGAYWFLRHKIWRWPTAPLFKLLDTFRLTSVITVVCKSTNR